MEHLVSSEVTGIEKLDPAFFKYFLKLTGLSPEQVVYIRDDLVRDIKPAKECGLKTGFFDDPHSITGREFEIDVGGIQRFRELFTQPEYQPDFNFTNFGELDRYFLQKK